MNNTVYNEGPSYEEISRESAEPIRRLRLERRVEIEGDRSSFRGEQMRSRVDGDSLRVFAPGFDARAAAPPQKLSAKIEKVEVNRGWKDAGPAADVEKLRAKVRGEAKVPKELPPQPKFEKLADQKPAPGVQPAKGKPVPVAPGETPRGEKMKDARKGKDLPIAPVVPPVEPKAAPLEKPAAPKAPLKQQQPSKAENPAKPTDAEVRLSGPLRPPEPKRSGRRARRPVPSRQTSSAQANTGSNLSSLDQHRLSQWNQKPNRRRGGNCRQPRSGPHRRTNRGSQRWNARKGE